MKFLHGKNRGIASGWTISRCPEDPEGPDQNYIIGLESLIGPCPWAPEGLAMPVGKNLVILQALLMMLQLYITKCAELW